MTKNEIGDAELTRLAKQGDEPALALLFRRHEARVLARIRRRLHPGLARKVDPEDVLQDVYVVVARKLGEFDGAHDGSFGLWLSRITDHKVRETMRGFLDTARRDVRAERGRGLRPDTSQFRCVGATPSQTAMGLELLHRARLAKERLPPEYRRVLDLVQGEGMKFTDVAEVLDRSYEATKKLYARALRRFRELLEEPPSGASRAG